MITFDKIILTVAITLLSAVVAWSAPVTSDTGWTTQGVVERHTCVGGGLTIDCTSQAWNREIKVNFDYSLMYSFMTKNPVVTYQLWDFMKTDYFAITNYYKNANELVKPLMVGTASIYQIMVKNYFSPVEMICRCGDMTNYPDCQNGCDHFYWDEATQQTVNDYRCMTSNEYYNAYGVYPENYRGAFCGQSMQYAGQTLWESDQEWKYRRYNNTAFSAYPFDYNRYLYRELISAGDSVNGGGETYRSEIFQVVPVTKNYTGGGVGSGTKGGGYGQATKSGSGGRFGGNGSVIIRQ